MSDTMQGPGGPDELAIPWIDVTMQQEVAWRDGDIVISVPVKSGTTWTMNIVHQLRSGGDADFADVYAEVPWLEFVPSPDARRDDLLAAFEQMPRDRRRAFKSHSAPPDLPYLAPGSGPDVRYVVVMRNPDEAVASMRPFIAGHSEAWFDLWQIPKDDIVGPDLATFVEMLAGPLTNAIFGFVAVLVADLRAQRERAASCTSTTSSANRRRPCDASPTSSTSRSPTTPGPRSSSTRRSRG